MTASADQRAPRPAPTPGPQPPRRPSRWPLAFALLIVAAGLFELGADLLQRRAVPTRDDWRAAGKHVREHYRPGDLIVTAPAWADPLGRLVLGDLLTLDDVTRPDARTYRRIWELSIRGKHHPDVRGLKRSGKARTFGGVTVTLYEQTPVTVSTDFYENLPQARVYEDRRGKRIRCRWKPRRLRHDCGPGWKAVKQVRAEIGYTAKRCILAMPFDGAARVIEYDQARLAERLVVWTGLRGYDPRYRARRAVWEYRRYRAGKLRKRKRPPRPVTAVPVTLQVSVDGREVGRIDHAIDDESWHRHELKLPAGTPRQGKVQYRITTRHGWAKHFCFYARSEGATR